jgi:hypothetical protein
MPFSPISVMSPDSSSFRSGPRAQAAHSSALNHHLNAENLTIKNEIVIFFVVFVTEKDVILHGRTQDPVKRVSCKIVKEWQPYQGFCGQ